MADDPRPGPERLDDEELLGIVLRLHVGSVYGARLPMPG